MENLLKKYRQDLHRIPELAYEEYKTKAYLLKILSQYDCEITELCSTGICAFFQASSKMGKRAEDSKTIAFRSDMDGLPVHENTEAPYRSCHKGMMHACGHDGHMSMLLAFAQKVDEIISTLTHNVLLIFQPAEETLGGASCICQAGILTKYNVKRIFGIHLWPMLKKHTLGSRSLEFMAKSSEIDIIINGKSAHTANSENGIDSLYIGCQLVHDLYSMVENELPQTEPKLLKFGKMSSGRVRNTISAYTELQGTIRSFHMETFHFITNRIDEIALYYQEKYKCIIEVNYSKGYPPVINDPILFAKVKDMLKEFEFHTFENPFMLSEDFSFYQQAVPGLFLFLGTGTNIPLHNSKFDFEEDVLHTGLKVYLKLLELE